MEIWINQQLVNIEIQLEKNVGELLQGIGTWLKGNGFSILEIKLDGTVCAFDDPSWRARSLDQVGKIEIEAPLLRELRHANLEILLEYLEQVFSAAKSIQEGQDALADLLPLAESFYEILPSTVYLSAYQGMTKGSMEEGLTANLRIELQDVVYSAKKGDFRLPENLVAHAGHLILISQDRMREALAPHQEASNTAQVLRSSMQELTMVSTLLMTGSEKQAFDSILRFSELLSKLLRIYWIILEECTPGEEAPFNRADLETWTHKTNETLEQISSAIEGEDIITLGDLLEYELPDHISGLLGLMHLNQE